MTGLHLSPGGSVFPPAGQGAAARLWRRDTTTSDFSSDNTVVYSVTFCNTKVFQSFYFNLWKNKYSSKELSVLWARRNADDNLPQAGHNKRSTCSSWQHVDYGGDSLHNRLALLDPIPRILLLPRPGISRVDCRLNTMRLTALQYVSRWHTQSTATLVLPEIEPPPSNSRTQVPRNVSISLTKPNSKILFSSTQKGGLNSTLPVTVETVTERKTQEPSCYNRHPCEQSQSLHFFTGITATRLRKPEMLRGLGQLRCYLHCALNCVTRLLIRLVIFWKISLL